MTNYQVEIRPAVLLKSLCEARDAISASLSENPDDFSQSERLVLESQRALLQVRVAEMYQVMQAAQRRVVPAAVKNGAAIIKGA